MPMNPRLLRPLQTGFSPQKIAGLQLWLDGSDSSTITLNGTTVSEWRSKVGGIALTQGTAAAQPTLNTNYFSGRSALSFDGGDALATTSAGLAVAPSTSFIVFDETTAVGFAGLLVAAPASGDDFASATGRFITTVHDPTSSSARRGASPQAVAATALTADFNMGTTGAFGKRLMAIRSSSSTALMRVGGVNGTEDTAHTQSGTSSGIVVGGRYVGGTVSASFRFNGVVCEILHYSQELSLAQIQTVERWLAQRWGFTL